MAITRTAPVHLRRLLATVLTGLTVIFLGIAPASASVFIYNVSVPTDALNAPANSASTPFTLLFEMVQGGGTDTAPNTATITDFNVTGPSSPINLTVSNSAFFADDQEPFTTNTSPGSTLSFTLSTTNNTDVGGAPDEFSFFILDNGDNPIPTTDAASSSLFTIDLGGFTPSVVTFEGMSTYTGVDPSVDLESVVPEPSPLAVFAAAFLGLGALIALKKRTSRSGA